MQGNEDKVYYSAFRTGELHHVHKSYIWLRSTVVSFFVILIFFTSGSSGIIQGISALREAGILTPVLIAVAIVAVLLVVFLLILIYHMLAYKRLYFVFNEQELGVYSGVITKHRVHVPYTRVQSVNHSASLVQRIVGVCTVKIDTAGGSANKVVQIPYVTLAVAEGVRTELFARKQIALSEENIRIEYAEERWTANDEPPKMPSQDGSAEGPHTTAQDAYESINDSARSWRGIAAGVSLKQEEASFSANLSGIQLLLTGASHPGAGITSIILGIIGLFSTFGIAVNVSAFGSVLIVLITLAFFIGGWLIGAISTMITYAGFRVVRRGNRIEVEHGALRHTFNGIDIARVQGVTIKQTLIRRLLGYCEVTLERISSSGSSASDGSSDSSDVRGIVVHPFIRVDEAMELIDALVPEFSQAPKQDELEHLPKCAFRRALIRRCIWTNWSLYLLAATLIFHLIWSTTALSMMNGSGSPNPLALINGYGAVLIVIGIIFVLTTVLKAIGAVLWFRGSGFNYNKQFVTLFNDGLYTKHSVVPRNKIQAGCTCTNPFQQASGVSSVRVITAAGVQNTTFELRDVEANRARAWLTWVEPRVRA